MLKPSDRGCFITLEGPEGGGKTTQARRLVARLEEVGLTVLYAREPGGTPTGEVIRDLLQHDLAGEPLCPEAEVLLFESSRAQLVRHVILPALMRGAWVVCDRFADSTTAYQGYGRGFDVERMLTINDFAVGEAVPDRTVLLDLPVDRGLARVKQRGEAPDRIEREAQAFHERVREGYRALAARFSDRFCVVDASGSEDDVAASVWEAVCDLT